MKAGEIVQRRGCVTLLKFLVGKSLPELEQLIGYHSGRLAHGAYFARFRAGQPIQPSDIQLLGYSQVAEHHFINQYGAVTKQFNLAQLTKMAWGYWQEEGLHNIVKVFPKIDHDNAMDNDIQYPPGRGIPQWKLNRPFDFEVVKFVNVGERLIV